MIEINHSALFRIFNNLQGSYLRGKGDHWETASAKKRMWMKGMQLDYREKKSK